jgi:signal transduction histidine kinase
MLKFKHKILIAFIAIFITVSAVTLPFAQTTVMQIAKKAMEDRAYELIARIREAPNNEELIETLKMQKPLIFFRVAVISDEKKVLYDSHVKRVLGDEFSQEYVIDHPEVEQAFKTGLGYHEEYSKILDQEFAYFAKSFNFHGKTYVLRTAFPLMYVTTLSRDFEFGFIGSLAVILLIYSLLTWFVIHYLTRPIRKIITAIKPYEAGEEKDLPIVKDETLERSDEFGALARTLNALSRKIQYQINTLTDERNEKAAVLESLNEGVIAVDKNMHVTYANAMAQFFLGVKKNIIGAPYTNAKETKSFALLEKCQKEQTVLNDAIELKRGRQKYFVDLVAAPKDDGAVLVLQDKSPHYKMVEMRKDFIANASHELKTPITIIRGFAETLHDNPDLPKEKTLSITQRIVRSCERMTTLIQDLLKLADLEKLPEARLIDCDLKEIIQKGIDAVALVYPEVIFKVKGDKSYPLHADPSLLEHAITNLLDNGAKYSEPPKEISILLEQLEDKIQMTIKDRGIGIPEEDLPHIFERFYRVDKARSRKLGGSGLGLSIVQTIIEKHYGTIHVESKLGKGTSFVITLPQNL